VGLLAENLQHVLGASACLAFVGYLPSASLYKAGLDQLKIMGCMSVGITATPLTAISRHEHLGEPPADLGLGNPAGLELTNVASLQHDRDALGVGVGKGRRGMAHIRTSMISSASQ